MSEKQLKDFLEKIKGDTGLQEKLKAADSPDDVVGIAKELGHEFTADKFSTLSDEELENMAGGIPGYTNQAHCQPNTGGCTNVFQC